MPRYQNVTSTVVMIGEGYDPKCESLIVGVRSVLLLAMRRKWDCLEELGVEKTDFPFLMAMVDAYAGVPRTPEQVQQATKWCPALERAGKALVRKYLELKAPKRLQKVGYLYV